MNQLTTHTTEAAAVVLDLYDAITCGDVERARRAVTDDIRLRLPGTHALAGDHVGLDAILQVIAGLRRRTDDGEHFEMLDVLTGHDHVALYCRVTATRAGRRPLDNPTLHLARITDGRVCELTIHNRDDGPVDAFWS